MRMIMYEPKEVDVKITHKKQHAHPWDVITEKEEFKPMLVLSSYFEPHYLFKFNAGEIDEETLHNKGTGYVHAVGLDGRVRCLQYYEYLILAQGDQMEAYKTEIMSKWKCENIKYTVNCQLEPMEGV